MKSHVPNRRRLAPVLKILLCALCLTVFPRHTSAQTTNQLTFVLVHGAFGEGWDWKKVDQFLAQKGHVVYRPTLTGLGERAHLASPDIWEAPIEPV